MRKISLFLALSVSLLVATTGCLKDKGFEDQRYGIQISERTGVAFPQASSSPVIVGITGQAAPITIAGPLITIEGSGAASGDVTVNLQTDNAAVTAKGLVPLPAGSYTVSTLNPVIRKDSTYIDNITITINNSNTLDPTKTYGVGFKITGVSQGYQIASNSNTVVFGITIKNKYDGVYRLKGFHNRPGFQFPYDQTMHMITTGPNTVQFYWPEVRSVGHPIGTGPNPAVNVSWYGAAIAPVVEFNQTTNLVTNVFNADPVTPISIYTGLGSGQGRFVETSPTVKTMYVYWRYNANDARAFMDTLTYISPRP
ncbi:MAG: hypothetical protein JWP69_1505 [Flaviaesturariibacter sp.]|nr:hypothetical protein [Flaviaesturariibacter sp.]